jgi:hypothetical protein
MQSSIEQITGESADSMLAKASLMSKLVANASRAKDYAALVLAAIASHTEKLTFTRKVIFDFELSHGSLVAMLPAVVVLSLLYNYASNFDTLLAGGDEIVKSREPEEAKRKPRPWDMSQDELFIIMFATSVTLAMVGSARVASMIKKDAKSLVGGIRQTVSHISAMGSV